MFIHSIRWRFQIWYGFILVAVLAGFGVTAFQLERGRVLRRIDDELHRRAGLLLSSLRPPARDGPRPDDAPPVGEAPQPLPDQPPPDLPPGDAPPGFGPPQPPKNFHLPPQAASLFDETDTNGFYYVFTWRDDHVVARSANAPRIVMGAGYDDQFNRINAPSALPASTPGAKPPGNSGGAEQEKRGQVMVQRDPLASPPRMHGGFREVEVQTPPGDTILVGRCIAPELAEFRRLKLTLAGAGGVILLLGLAGGWWLGTRAIRPIADISAAAAKISAGDLSRRIGSADTESELGQLAAVLNSTFARLEAAFAQQQQFTSDAAHELRTPVSVVLTQTQAALNRDRPAAEYRESLEACERAAQRMRRLIESLLELARMDAGQEQIKRMPFDLSTTAKDCAELIRPLAEQRGVKIILDLQPAGCVGDADRIGSVITNLLTNAVQYNQAEGEVRIATVARNGTAILSVSDTGPGISPEDLPRVFERFYRADKSRSSANTGLGLAISRAIIAAHGGSIEAASPAGQGATFTVRLPVC